MLIDTHCHLHDREFFTAKQAEEMIARANKAGVKKMVCIGTSHEDSLAAQEFASKHDNVYWTYGVHPEVAGVLTDESFRGWTFSPSTSYTGTPGKSALRAAFSGPSGIYVSGLENLEISPRKTSSATPAPVAIGEVGLDYHYEGYNREAQIKLFEQMLQLASDNDLPVSFHVREAFEDFFAVMKNFPQVRGVVHSFTDSKKVLKRILNETEFYIGVNGLATYSTLPTPPLERILLETDAPFLTPVPFRGIINEPAYIREIANWLSSKLGKSFKATMEETTKNARRLYGI